VTAVKTSLGGRLLRDEYRHVPQRRLLLGEPLHFRARPGVRDRGRDQIRESLQAILGVRWQQRVSRRDDHRAPEPALYFDRDSDRCDGAKALHAGSEACVSDRRVVIKSGREPRAVMDRGPVR
jgi:hypothetical protein